jgi:hypothetical protein
MYSLTDEQITFIENDIKVRGITSPDLSIDLLDHICCIIENSLDEYRNFDTVYQETLLLFGDKGLKEIQDETNRLLTFKHYYFMNSTMKISGYVSSLMILVGAFFKFQHWPGANVMLVFGTFLLTVLFLPLLFILKFKSTAENNRSIVLSIIGFVAALLICSGILFRIMHWPGARMVTITGAVLLVLGYLPVYILSVYKNTTDKINATATVILIIAGVGLLVSESGSGIPRTTSDSFWRGVTENEQTLLQMQKTNQLLYQKSISANTGMDSFAINNIKILHTNAEQVITYINDMKLYLIAACDDFTEEQAKSVKLDDLRTAGGGAGIQAMLDPNNSSEYSAAKLKASIESYKSLLSEIAPSVDVALLETNELTVYGEPTTWEQANFYYLPISLVVFNLNRIALAVETSENAAIGNLR